MGYELDRLMAQHGVSSATASPYVAPPPREQDNSVTAANQAAYDAAMAQARAYKQDYQQRVAGTPMYSAQQFYTGASDSGALKGMRQKHPDIGQTALDNAIRTWFTANPAASTNQIREYMNSIGANPYDFMRATGSAWGSPLRMPTFAPNYAASVATNNTGNTGNTGNNNGSGNTENQPGYTRDGAARGGLMRAKGYRLGGFIDAEEEPGAAEVAAPMMPAAAPVGAVPGATPRTMDMMEMLSRMYAPRSEELSAAQNRMRDETEAFNRLITNAMTQREAPPDKAEMYFRLAAAFGAPTKTGHFAEALGNVGQVMGEYTKSQRESAASRQQQKIALALEAQKLRMQGAREDLQTEKSLQIERGKDAREAIKAYIESGKPQSAAGKQAMDEGLQPGTPAYQKRVSELAELNVERQMAMIQAQMAGVTAAMGNLAVSQGNLAVRQSAEGRAAEAAKKLTPQELKLKVEAEDSLSSLDNAMSQLQSAYKLAPKAFGNTVAELGQRKILENTNPNDPRVLATRELENLLKSEMIGSAAEKMKGVLSDSDIKLLKEVQGVDAKSPEERQRILINAYKALQRGRAKQQKRINEINAGLYRSTTPITNTEELP